MLSNSNVEEKRICGCKSLLMSSQGLMKQHGQYTHSPKRYVREALPTLFHIFLLDIYLQNEYGGNYQLLRAMVATSTALCVSCILDPMIGFTNYYHLKCKSLSLPQLQLKLSAIRRIVSFPDTKLYSAPTQLLLTFC